jgi:hypothetical protein
MPARVVVVLREQALANKTAEALINAGYDAVAMRNSMAALKVLARLMRGHGRDSLADEVQRSDFVY